jgi:hypothetical protein
MSLIFSVCSVFGNLFVIRTLQIFRMRALIAQQVLTKIGTVAICSAVFAIFLSETRPIEAAVLLFSAVFAPLPLMIFLERRRLQVLRSYVPVFLDRWIMNLKLGAASASARELALTSQSADFQALMRPLFTSSKGAICASHPLLPAFASREMARLRSEPHMALQRLENLRQVLRKTDDFRRKSGQAMRQTAIQSAVMLLLYAALLVFTIFRGGWHANSDLVLWSGVFTLIGTAGMSAIARKRGWKI